MHLLPPLIDDQAFERGGIAVPGTCSTSLVATHGIRTVSSGRCTKITARAGRSDLKTARSLFGCA